MVGQQVLALLIEVRILVPEQVYKIPRFVVFCYIEY